MAEPMEVVELVRSALREHGALSFDELLKKAYDHPGAIAVALGYLRGQGALFHTREEHLYTLRNTDMISPEPTLIEEVQNVLATHPRTFDEICAALNESRTSEVGLALGWLMAKRPLGVTGTRYELYWTLLN